MAKLSRKHGRTSVILLVFIADSTSSSGAGLTGLTYNSPGLTAYYYREYSTDEVAITLANMTLGTYTSGGFKEVDATNMPGVYAFCPPDLAFDNGSYSVFMMLKGATNMVPLPLEIDLEADVNVTEIGGHIIAATGTVTFPNATLASTTNITAASGITLADGAITADKIATGALTAAKFASDFFTSVASGVWNALTSGLSTVGSIGKLLVDNINATISSRASLSAQTSMQTDVTSILGDTNELQLDWVNGGRLDNILDARASQTSVDTAQGDLTTLIGRLTSARAGYLDKLNVTGNVASQSDVLAINQSASRRIIIVTVSQYERPETGDTSTYTIEVRTYDADGAAVNADSTPVLAATGIISGSLAANLSAASNPSTGLYSWTYTVEDDSEVEQIRFSTSATIDGSAFPISTFSQVVDLVSETWTNDDRTKLIAIFDKLPSRGHLVGTEASTGAFTTADIGLASADLDIQFDGLTTLINNLNDYNPAVDTVIVGQNNDKTGYGLSVLYDAAKTAASQTSVNSLQTSVNDVPNNAEFDAAIATIITAIAGLNDLDETQIETIVTEAIDDAALATSSMLTAVQKMVEADVVIDKSVTPWAVVWKERGTATEIIRKQLKDVDGGNITSVSTVIGQTVQ